MPPATWVGFTLNCFHGSLRKFTVTSCETVYGAGENSSLGVRVGVEYLNLWVEVIYWNGGEKAISLCVGTQLTLKGPPTSCLILFLHHASVHTFNVHVTSV